MFLEHIMFLCDDPFSCGLLSELWEGIGMCGLCVQRTSSKRALRDMMNERFSIVHSEIIR